MWKFTDTHFHSLHMQERGIDVHELFSQLFSDGFPGGIDVGTHYEDIPQRKQLLGAYRGIILSGGIHPGAVSRESTDQLLAGLRFVEDAACRGDIRFIGECGIDLYRSPETREKQELLFARQLELSRMVKLPVIIHTRDAEDAVRKVLLKHPPESGGIMHCFSGDKQFALEMQDMGLHISFAGNITYRKNDSLREALKHTAMDKLLFETDSPFLAPEPKRGRVNHPGHIRYTYAAAAEILQTSPQALAARCSESFRTLARVLP